MSKFKLLAGVVLAAFGAGAADAAISVTVAQTNGNVVFTSTGSFNTSALAVYSSNSATVAAVRGSPGFFAVGADGAAANIFSGFTGPSTFGTGTSLNFADSTSGTGFDINANASYLGNTPALIFDKSYVSGTTFTSTATYTNTTIANLGLTNGNYVFKSNLTNETITVQVGQAVAPVPETATWAMMIAGVGLVGAAMRRRQQVRVTFA